MVQMCIPNRVVNRNHLTPSSLCLYPFWILISFLNAIQGSEREGQSSSEYGLHVLGPDRLCHRHPQQAGSSGHPASCLPRSSRGKTALWHPPISTLTSATRLATGPPASAPIPLHTLRAVPTSPASSDKPTNATLKITRLHGT